MPRPQDEPRTSHLRSTLPNSFVIDRGFGKLQAGTFTGSQSTQPLAPHATVPRCCHGAARETHVRDAHWRRAHPVDTAGRAAASSLPQPRACRSLEPAGDVPAGDVPAGDVPAGDVPPGDEPAQLSPKRRANTRSHQSGMQSGPGPESGHPTAPGLPDVNRGPVPCTHTGAPLHVHVVLSHRYLLPPTRLRVLRLLLRLLLSSSRVRAQHHRRHILLPQPAGVLPASSARRR